MAFHGIKQAGQKENSAQRRELVLEMRIQGKSMRVIARALGVNESTVCRDLQASLSELAKRELGNASELRELELERIDEAIAKMHPHLGTVHAVDRWVKLIELRCKLLGLLTPIKIAPTSPDGEQEYTGGGFAAELASRIAGIAARIGTAETDSNE